MKVFSLANRKTTFATIVSFTILGTLLFSRHSLAKANTEFAQRTAEQQVRHLLEPLLDKYCHDECKLLSVNIVMDLATQDSVVPGFDDTDSKKGSELAPSSGQAKILMNDKIGPVSRTKLLALVQQYLDTLDYPVKVDTQVAHFPMPQGSEGKIAEMREKISTQFQSTIEEFLKQFCPQSCLLADYRLQTEVVNGEEAQYGTAGEFIQDGDTAIRIKNISATLLMDQSLSPEEQANVLEMARLKTSAFKNVQITPKSLKFPHPAALSGRGGRIGPNGELGSDVSVSDSKTKLENKSSSDSKTNTDSKQNSDSKSTINQTTGTTETNNKTENFSRVEKIERVENGDAVQSELQKFKLFGVIFSSAVLALLIFIALSTYQSPGSRNSNANSSIQRIFQGFAPDPVSSGSTVKGGEGAMQTERNTNLSTRYEIERILEELSGIYAQQPRVAKQVFGRVLTEEGVEATAECISIFGEGIVVDLLRDPSLQSDLAELMDFYAKNPIDLKDEQKLELLRKLQSRTVSGKLAVLGSRSSSLFDFLAEMDGLQILELIRTESLTVKSIILTQCDAQKRSVVYSQLDPDIRMKLLAELSRIDYLPRDYIFNVANALKRKKRDNPKLNTEALPGSEVLVSLLERTSQSMQRTVVKNLEATNPDSARTVKSKLVSVETLRYLRDGQLLEVVLSLKHEELVQFLKGAPEDIRRTIFAKSPKDLVLELEDEIIQMKAISREAYIPVERKILNRMKVMANEGHINLVETNERMFGETTSNNSSQTGSFEPGRKAS